jgi:hypothetical protein
MLSQGLENEFAAVVEDRHISQRLNSAIEMNGTLKCRKMSFYLGN